MGEEIERKYVATDSPEWRDRSDGGTRIVQGYLSLDPDRTVRVRLRGDDRGLLTVKGRNDGPTRAEFEYEIPRGDAEQLLELCVGAVIDKVRHEVEVDGRTWEVDVFAGDNDGLIVAEVELDDADAAPEPPSWVVEDVTDDPAYYNAKLVEHPFRSWS